MLRYEFINKDEIPEDLEPGIYCTPIVDTKIENGDFVITIKYTGEKYDPQNPQSLITMTKVA